MGRYASVAGHLTTVVANVSSGGKAVVRDDPPTAALHSLAADVARTQGRSREALARPATVLIDWRWSGLFAASGPPLGISVSLPIFIGEMLSWPPTEAASRASHLWRCHVDCLFENFHSIAFANQKRRIITA
jgi:hypothetical protein